jgi:hypothetical protein
VKLLFCKACQDLFRLFTGERACRCGETRGRYVGDIDAIYSGEPAVPLGIENSSFAKAVTLQPPYGDGYRFEAFVIPMKCAAFTKED